MRSSNELELLFLKNKQKKLHTLLEDVANGAINLGSINITEPFPVIFTALEFRYLLHTRQNPDVEDEVRLAKDNRIVRLFLNHPTFNPNELSRLGETALTIACNQKDVELVEALLRHNDIDPNLPDKNGLPPLYHAVKNGNVEIVEALLRHDDIDPNWTDSNGLCLLRYAEENNHFAVIEALLKHRNINPNLKDKNDYTPLCHAVTHGNFAFAEMLLAHRDIDTNWTDSSGKSLLYYAVEDAIKDGNLQFVEALLKHPDTDPNLVVDKNGYSALYEAVASGNSKLTQLLLTHPKIDPNLKNKNGFSPLYTAVAEGHVEIVKALLKKKAHADTTLWTVAKAYDHKDVMKILPKPSLFRRIFPKKIIGNQSWLISPMQKLGYKSDAEGVCYGVAHMGVQAFLASDNNANGMRNFYARLARIESIPPKEIQNVVNQAKQKRIEIVGEVNAYSEEEIKEQIKKIKPDYNLEAVAAKERKRFLIEAMIEQRLTPQEQIDLDIPTFFEGVELYQQSYQYRKLFEQGAKPSIFQSGVLTAPLVTSQELAAQGGMANIDGFSGVYNHDNLDELTAYFHSLKSVLDSEPAFNHPIAIVLNNANHAISVGYDPKSKSFIIIDANNLESDQHNLHYATAAQIADEVKKAFYSKDVTIMRSEVYVGANHYHEFKQRLTDWKATKEFQSIHTITAEKAKKIDNKNNCWAYSAAAVGQTDLARQLLIKAGPVGFLKRHWKPLLIGGLLATGMAITGALTFGIVPLIMSVGVAVAIAGGGAAAIGTDGYYLWRAKETANIREKSLEDLEKKQPQQEKTEIAVQQNVEATPSDKKERSMSTTGGLLLQLAPDKDDRDKDKIVEPMETMLLSQDSSSFSQLIQQLEQTDKRFLKNVDNKVCEQILSSYEMGAYIIHAETTSNSIVISYLDDQRDVQHQLCDLSAREFKTIDEIISYYKDKFYIDAPVKTMHDNPYYKEISAADAKQYLHDQSQGTAILYDDKSGTEFALAYVNSEGEIETLSLEKDRYQFCNTIDALLQSMKQDHTKHDKLSSPDFLQTLFQVENPKTVANDETIIVAPRLSM